MEQILLRDIEELRDIIGGRKFLLVHGRHSYDRLPIKGFFDGMPHVEFSDITPNPLYEQAVSGVEVFRESGAELIVAVGGGSAMDIAKCIKLYCRMDSDVSYLEQEKRDTGVMLIAIPTTAGTGSEATPNAVIYHEGVKQTIAHSSLIPDVAVLLPELLAELPLYQKKCTMLDALVQSIEAWWNVNSTAESREFSRKAVELIRDNWRRYIFGCGAGDSAGQTSADAAGSGAGAGGQGSLSLTAAAAVMEAAYLSGKALSITATTAAHAMGYKITTMYGFPHGHAVAVCLVAVWKYILENTDKCVDSRGEEYLKKTLKEMPELSWFVEIMEELGMEKPKAVNREEELSQLVASVNLLRLKNVPALMEALDLRALYEEILD